MDLPEDFLNKMKNLLKDDEFEAYMESFNEERHYGLRVNTLKKDKPLWPLESVPWCSGGYYFDPGLRPAKSPFYHGGLYYIQEPSAMAPVSFMDIRPGHKVLDVCAAPGGKTTQIAARLEGKGMIVSNDVSASRARALVKNIENLGITNALVTNEEPERLASAFPGFFDAILVDAPCSGEGMFRKEPSMAKSWSTNRTLQFTALQRKILRHVAHMLKPGGELMYSTCTFSPEENELMIQEFLDTHEEFQIIPIDRAGTGLEPGRAQWAGGDARVSGCARIWPYKVKGEGHFMARLRKKDNPGSALQPRSALKKEKPVKDIELFHSFCKLFMNRTWSGPFIRNKDSLYLVPEALGDELSERLRGIRVARSGWYLGELKTGRFEPSQAFAMGIKKEMCRAVIDFERDDEQVIRYLKGESFPAEALEGWNLVCIEGFPLGWGKVQKGRLKNKYLPGWRMA